jgi:hypothetical protein
VAVDAVVEARLAGEPEAHRAPDGDDAADQTLPLLADAHEVLHLGDALGGEEAGDEDVRVREVELLRRRLPDRRQAEGAAALGVEDGREDAGRVEVGPAEPVDRPVRADER